MNLDYLKKPDRNGKSPFDIADAYIKEFRLYREAIKRGLITREDLALFWGLAMAQDELLSIPIEIGPPIDVYKTEEGAYSYLADKLDCEVDELKERVFGPMERVGNAIPELTKNFKKGEV